MPAPNIDANLRDADWLRTRRFDLNPKEMVDQIRTAPISWVRRTAKLPMMEAAPPEVRRAVTRRLKAGR
jgi:hypothetical protein